MWARGYKVDGYGYTNYWLGLIGVIYDLDVISVI
jgi:hypothetical protein